MGKREWTVEKKGNEQWEKGKQTVGKRETDSRKSEVK